MAAVARNRCGGESNLFKIIYIFIFLMVRNDKRRYVIIMLFSSNYLIMNDYYRNRDSNQIYA